VQHLEHEALAADCQGRLGAAAGSIERSPQQFAGERHETVADRHLRLGGAGFDVFLKAAHRRRCMPLEAGAPQKRTGRERANV
jgi:hypothetical protein